MKLFKRLFVPDTHAPFHDRKAFSLMLDVAKEFAPDECIIEGDFFDCYTASQYTKDPQATYKVLKEELADARPALVQLQRACGWAAGASNGKCRFVFLQGNHEERIDRYVAANAAPLGGLVNTREVLELPKSFVWYPYGQENRHWCGPGKNLLVTHGTITNKHVCAAMLDRYGVSVIFGHTHRVQQHTKRNARGERLIALTNGWLGDPLRAQEYIKNVSEAQHAFTLGYFQQSAPFKFWLETIEIQNGQLVWDGALRG